MSLNVLCISWGTTGNLSPVLTAARQLRRAGHRPRVMADPAMCGEVEAAAFPFVGWRRAPTGLDADPADFSDLADWLRRTMFAPAGAYAADTLDEIRRLPTDAVLSLDLLPGCALAAEAADLPHAVLSPHISIRPLPGIPPAASGLTPPRTEAERDAVDAATAAIVSAMEQGRPALNAARRAFGLPPVASAFAHFDRADRVLLAVSRAFDFDTQALPANYRYIGPLLDEPGWSRGALTAWPGARRPRILVAGSTGAQNQTALLRRVARAVGTVEAETVVTTGPNVGAADLDAPAAVRVVAAASHDALMARADLVVCQGGHGTVSRALLHGVPLLVIPLARDQADNAARVALRGAGLRLPAGADEAEIAAAARRLLAEPGFRRAAEALGAAVRADLDAGGLVREIDAMVAARRDPGARGVARGGDRLWA
ncbi:UDP:flavonoid glycosyltransferase YjiC (YdhE family) [Methylobacterium sp. PvP062]|uniref:glycosyltransferase n=1 Tax=Methylobacterium TaxID=407 RepID=UPI000464BF2A|nr:MULTISPECIES: nucleotide disphospho-sugar-binding domain-containing protein [unclassified Methylobacterium]KTS08306.1 glycosyl transferase family 28 [Methylobacterium radiotolerans]MCX7334730.1 glycosyltransferase [Hyphomicrobiales bacterium]KTS47450.1 glycosyl transferase family 28 [Methylobacterium radiotolerans]KZC03488.1 4'-demethylrebeccamycin synthase [Methylobacterium radiotolerans]MBP2494781.1 UDP:flavonoid glycosyltransferase YjiC (YdhE family) [Methylobacterium sp. PvP105]